MDNQQHCFDQSAYVSLDQTAVENFRAEAITYYIGSQTETSPIDITQLIDNTVEGGICCSQ